MNKVVIACNGLFGLSYKAMERLIELGFEDIFYDGDDEWARKMDSYVPTNLDRHDPRLIQVVEELGELANSRWTTLKIVTIPGNKYRVLGRECYEIVETPENIVWIEHPGI